MKLKKFVKPFSVYTEVEIYNDDTNQTLYTGEVFYIPKQLLKYKIDPYAEVIVELKDNGNTKYTNVAIPVLENC